MKTKYLENLIADKQELIRILKGNGVYCLDTDTFTVLIPKTRLARGVQIKDFRYLFHTRDALNNKGLLYNCSAMPTNLACTFSSPNPDRDNSVVQDKDFNNVLFKELNLTNCNDISYFIRKSDYVTTVDMTKWIIPTDHWMYATEAFFYCDRLKYVRTNNVVLCLINPIKMFSLSKQLVEVPNFKVRGNATGMFSNCYALTNITIDLSEATNLTGIFTGTAITNFNINNTTLLTTSIESMFSNCTSLQDCRLENINFINLTNAASLFNKCNKLQYLSLKGCSFPKIPADTNLIGGTCYASTINFENVKFRTDVKLGKILISAPNVKELDFTTTNLKYCNLTGGILNYGNYYNNLRSLKLGFDNPNLILNYNHNYTSFKFEYIDTEQWTCSYNVGSLEHLFSNCPNLINIDLSKTHLIKTNPSYNNRYWFVNNPSLKFADISGFDLSLCGNMKMCFGGTTPQDCLIIVKDETSKEKLLQYNSTLTNIKTKEEYENEQ